MTEAQAIKFLQNRQRNVVAGGKFFVGEVISRIKSQSRARIFMALSYIFIASIGIEHSSGFRIFMKVFLIAASLCMIGNAVFNLVRLRQVRQALNYATLGSSRLSGTR